MVHFSSNSFTIEVITASNPIEDWLETHEQLIGLLQNQDLSSSTPDQWRVLELLSSMMPDRETAKKMAI